MKKVLVYSALLIAGLVLSQIIPGLIGYGGSASAEHGGVYDTYAWIVRLLTMTALSFIMIHVGYEFDIDKRNVRQYGWDYVVAATAAAFPWIFCAAYFVFVIVPSTHWGDWYVWKETLLASRFAAPTSAGVLFSMLAAAGLAATWVFRKARILAIFDDLDTVLLMIPLKMMMVGVRWQLAVIVLLMAVQLWLAWRYLHAVPLSIRWKWVMLYSVVIVAVSEVIYLGSKGIDAQVPVHIEVLLPAFVLGCMIRRPVAEHAAAQADPHGLEAEHDAGEARVSGLISAAFMLLVGLSMPPVINAIGGAAAPAPTPQEGALIQHALERHVPAMGWGTIAMHVLIVTVVSNVGKMFPALCYRREAHWRERLAVAVGMWPRGEVGAGVLVVSLSYGIGGPVVTIAMLSLALNLVLTGAFIAVVKKLLAGVPAPTAAAA